MGIIISEKKQKKRSTSIKRWILYGGFGALAAINIHSCQKDKPYEQALYQKENISVLEKTLKSELQIAAKLKKDHPGWKPKVQKYGTERSAIQTFNTDVKKDLETFLKIPTYENPTIRTGYVGSWASPLNIGIIGLFSLGMGVSLWDGGRSLRDAGKSGWNTLTGKQSFLRGSLHTVGNVFFTGVNAALAAFFAYNAVTHAASSVNFYDPWFNEISIAYTPIYDIHTQGNLTMVLAHESVHYLQDKYNVDSSPVLWEGHARGVELQLAKQQYAKTNNPDYLWGPLNREIDDMVGAYLDLCNTYGVKPASWIKGSSSMFVGEHAKGTALFKIREHQWGAEIYTDVLKGDYCKIFNSPAQNKCL